METTPYKAMYKNNNRKIPKIPIMYVYLVETSEILCYSIELVQIKQTTFEFANFKTKYSVCLYACEKALYFK